MAALNFPDDRTGLVPPGTGPLQDGDIWRAPNGVSYTWNTSASGGYWSATFQADSTDTLSATFLRLDAANAPLLGDLTIGAANQVSLKTDGTAAFAGKATSAATVAGDSATTLVTKGYLEGTNSGTGGGGYVQLKSSTQQDIGTGGLSIAGNVGIGRTDPAYKLDVFAQYARIGNATEGILQLGASGVDGNNFHFGSTGQTLRLWSGTIGAGVERLRIKSNGNVGVGEDDPFTTLHVTKAIDGGPPATSGTLDSNVITRLQGGSVALDFGGLATGVQWIQPRNVNNLSNNYTLAVCPNGGNLGVGTTNAGAKLTVTDLTGTGPVYLADFRAISKNQNPLIRLIGRNAADDGTTSVDFYKVWGEGFTINNNDADGDNFTAFTIGGDEHVRIVSDGKVGIGTATPQVGILDLTRTGTAGTISSFRQLRIGLDANPNYSGYIGYGSSLSEQKLGLIIESYDNGNTSKTLINPNGGNVGIGTKNPVEAITVEGKGRFNYVSVDADLRFAKESATLYTRGANGRGVSIGCDFDTKNPFLQGNFMDNLDGGVTPLLINPSGGDVGIGTDEPKKPLHVNGDILIPSGNAFKTNCYYTDKWNYLDTSRVSAYVNMATASGRFSLGTGSANVDPVERVSIFPGGQVTLGRTSVLSNAVSNEALLTISDNAANKANIAFINLHNSASIQNNYTLGQINFTGQQNIGYIGAAIRGKGTEVWGADDHGSVIEFATVGNGGNSLQNRAFIDSNGINLNTSHGLVFSSNGNGPGVTSNTLYDYEEGTFTATVAATISATYDTTRASYIKVGNIVYFQIYLKLLSGTFTSTAPMEIYGLPFTASGATAGYGGAFRNYGSWAADPDNDNITYHIQASSAKITLYVNQAVIPINSSLIAPATGGRRLIICGQYITG